MAETPAQVGISMLANEAASIVRKLPAGPWATLARSAAVSVRLAKQRRKAERLLADVRHFASRANS